MPIFTNLDNREVTAFGSNDGFIYYPLGSCKIAKVKLLIEHCKTHPFFDDLSYRWFYLKTTDGVILYEENHDKKFLNTKGVKDAS